MTGFIEDKPSREGKRQEQITFLVTNVSLMMTSRLIN